MKLGEVPNLDNSACVNKLMANTINCFDAFIPFVKEVLSLLFKE